MEVEDKPPKPPVEIMLWMDSPLKLPLVPLSQKFIELYREEPNGSVFKELLRLNTT
jgi:hypothetical protein